MKGRCCSWNALKNKENKLCGLQCLAQDVLGGENPPGSRRVLIKDRGEINMWRVDLSTESQ